MKINQKLKVPAQYVKDTQRLMDLFCIPIEEAYHYLQSFGFHLQTAINNRFEPDLNQIYNQINALPKIRNNPINQNSSIDLTKNQDKRIVSQMRRKNQKDAERKNYQKTYLIKKIQKIKKKKKSSKKRDIINLQAQSKQKIDEEFNFKTSLQKLVEGEVNVSFQQDVYSTFQNLWKQQQKLIALHCIKFLDSTQLVPPFKEMLQFTKQVYKTPLFVEVFNKQYINYGLDVEKFDFSSFQFFKEFVSKTDSYSIIILRYNTMKQKIEVYKKLAFSQTFKLTSPEQFRLLSKIIKQQNYKTLQKQRYRNQKQQMNEQQKKKLIQDRALKQQQQQLYFKQINSHLKIIQEQTVPVPVVPLIQQKDLYLIRKNKRSQLTIYPQDITDPINLKVRLPNSQVIFYRLPKTQTLQYLFTSIENSEQNQLGFEDQVNRKFDLILPLERISLTERRTHTLCQIFGDSDMETLIVREI